jgi:predicted nucleic acid-binding Zn ribbon protein
MKKKKKKKKKNMMMMMMMIADLFISQGSINCGWLRTG